MSAETEPVEQKRVLLPWPWLLAAFGLGAVCTGAVSAAFDITLPNVGVVIALLFLFWQFELLPITVPADADARHIRKAGWNILGLAIVIPIGFGLAFLFTQWLLDVARGWLT